MRQGYSVLVPGASAPAGINTIKSLKIAKRENKIVATDSSRLSAGFFMADACSVVPEASNPSFSARLIELVKAYDIGVLMPSSGYDIYPYSNNKRQLAEVGATAVVSDEEALRICQDKLLTFQALSGKFDVPSTTADPGRIDGFPVIAKPRLGKGSRDVIKIDDESDLKYVTSKYHDMVFQEYLTGQEYTVDVLSDLDGSPLVAVPRVRLQTRGGISIKGRIVRDEKLESACMDIAKSIGIRGPCCIQMKETVDRKTKLVEVNARMGGGTIFSTLAGVNFPAMILDMVEGKEVSVPPISEVTIIRYFEEIAVLESTSPGSSPSGSQLLSTGAL